MATERVRTRKSSNSKTQTLFCHLEVMFFFSAVIAAEMNDGCCSQGKSSAARRIESEERARAKRVPK